MAVCVVDVGSKLEVSETAIGSCTDYVLYTAAEYHAMFPVFSLTDISEMALAVVGVWAIAFCIKVNFPLLRR